MVNSFINNAARRYESREREGNNEANRRQSCRERALAYANRIRRIRPGLARNVGQSQNRRRDQELRSVSSISNYERRMVEAEHTNGLPWDDFDREVMSTVELAVSAPGSSTWNELQRSSHLLNVNRQTTRPRPFSADEAQDSSAKIKTGVRRFFSLHEKDTNRKSGLICRHVGEKIGNASSSKKGKNSNEQPKEMYWPYLKAKPQNTRIGEDCKKPARWCSAPTNTWRTKSRPSSSGKTCKPIRNNYRPYGSVGQLLIEERSWPLSSITSLPRSHGDTPNHLSLENSAIDINQQQLESDIEDVPIQQTFINYRSTPRQRTPTSLGATPRPESLRNHTGSNESTPRQQLHENVGLIDQQLEENDDDVPHQESPTSSENTAREEPAMSYEVALPSTSGLQNCRYQTARDSESDDLTPNTVISVVPEEQHSESNQENSEPLIEEYQETPEMYEAEIRRKIIRLRAILIPEPPPSSPPPTTPTPPSPPQETDERNAILISGQDLQTEQELEPNPPQQDSSIPNVQSASQEFPLSESGLGSVETSSHQQIFRPSQLFDAPESPLFPLSPRNVEQTENVESPLFPSSPRYSGVNLNQYNQNNSRPSLPQEDIEPMEASYTYRNCTSESSLYQMSSDEETSLSERRQQRRRRRRRGDALAAFSETEIQAYETQRRATQIILEAIPLPPPPLIVDGRQIPANWSRSRRIWCMRSESCSAGDDNDDGDNNAVANTSYIHPDERISPRCQLNDPQRRRTPRRRRLTRFKYCPTCGQILAQYGYSNRTNNNNAIDCNNNASGDNNNAIDNNNNNTHDDNNNNNSAIDTANEPHTEFFATLAEIDAASVIVNLPSTSRQFPEDNE